MNESSPELPYDFISVSIDIKGSRNPNSNENKIGKTQLLEFGNFLIILLSITKIRKITMSKYPK
ncbi:hypothetical protein [Winogradskyella sp. PG-2]|uniref:hypothetical protein n=1 Tax=Winogradskyella sp. PG-2 TaxID=754409 RepID=UPI00045860D6|nr:hypothetical protein [Winogradskyella sp. PG-2]BAO75342.1 hypothetical protein WPG_1112 [Winogradskyella sp. PG-2]